MKKTDVILIAQKPQAKQENAVCRFDFTLMAENIGVQKVRDVLSPICKEYVFQLEQGEQTGKIHYQGRFSLKVKKRLTQLAVSLQVHLKGIHLSITSNANRDNDFYVMKEDTRLDGPFTDKNEVNLPWDLKEMVTLRPWQETLRLELQHREKRKINIIYDRRGNTGKSSFVDWLTFNYKAGILDYCKDYRDVLRQAYCLGEKDIYLVDLARAIPKMNMHEFFAAIETLKGGRCSDDRYSNKFRRQGPPRICIFTNTLFDLSIFSDDRWDIRTINENNELVSYFGNKIENAIVPSIVENPIRDSLCFNETQTQQNKDMYALPFQMSVDYIDNKIEETQNAYDDLIKEIELDFKCHQIKTKNRYTLDF